MDTSVFRVSNTVPDRPKWLGFRMRSFYGHHGCIEHDEGDRLEDTRAEYSPGGRVEGSGHVRTQPSHAGNQIQS